MSIDSNKKIFLLDDFFLDEFFKGTIGYKNREQKRDFVNVVDCVNVNLFFFKNCKSGIYNVGYGIATTFNSVAKKIFNSQFKKLKIKYINMPLDIIEGYQNYTKGNINKLRKTEYKKNFYQHTKELKNINHNNDKT